MSLSSPLLPHTLFFLACAPHIAFISFFSSLYFVRLPFFINTYRFLYFFFFFLLYFTSLPGGNLVDGLTLVHSWLVFQTYVLCFIECIYGQQEYLVSRRIDACMLYASLPGKKYGRDADWPAAADRT